MLLRDKFWLWGHPEGRYNDLYGNERNSRMTPFEACMYLGIHKTFMIPVGWNINRRQYNKSFTPLTNVGWEFGEAAQAAGGDTHAVDLFLSEAREFPNITCAVFDDFLANGADKYSPEAYQGIHDKFHNNDVRYIDTWMVIYTRNYAEGAPEKDAEFAKHIKPYDGVIMWTWEEKDVPLIPEKFDALRKLAPNQRIMCGCYLWNFGEKKQATAEAVKWQLDWYREKLIAGEIEGVVFHTNTMADLDYEAYDAALEWMKEHGDEVLPD